jgi:hypothetical protein
MGVEDADEEARDEFMPSVVVGEEPELNGDVRVMCGAGRGAG